MLPPDPALFNSGDQEPTSDSGRSRRNDAISLGMFVSLLLDRIDISATSLLARLNQLLRHGRCRNRLDHQQEERQTVHCRLLGVRRGRNVPVPTGDLANVDAADSLRNNGMKNIKQFRFILPPTRVRVPDDC